jgi:hypothetical protein
MFPPGLARAGHEPERNGITNNCRDDWDRFGDFLGRADRGVSSCHDDINLETDQLGRKLSEPIVLSFRISVLNGDILSLHVAEVSEPSPERLDSFRVGGGRGGRKETYAGISFRLLRADGTAKRKEHRAKRKAKQNLPHELRSRLSLQP